MSTTIFRQVNFVCAGCGKVREQKAQLPVEVANAPLAPPEDWGTADVMAQRKQDGLLMVLAIPVCSEACGEKAIAGRGVPLIDTLVKNVKGLFDDKVRVVPLESAEPSRIVTPG